MADDALHRPLTPTRLRALLLESKPRIFLFELGQTVAGRAALMAYVPEKAQAVTRQIMVAHMLGPLGYHLPEPEVADKELRFFMATDDEGAVDEYRQLSLDWQLTLLEDAHGFLCDFNGWPGDNESGAGLYYENGTGRTALVFTNNDTALTAEIDDPEGVIADYEERRGEFHPGEDADV